MKTQSMVIVIVLGILVSVNAWAQINVKNSSNDILMVVEEEGDIRMGHHSRQGHVKMAIHQQDFSQGLTITTPSSNTTAMRGLNIISQTENTAYIGLNINMGESSGQGLLVATNNNRAASFSSVGANTLVSTSSQGGVAGIFRAGDVDETALLVPPDMGLVGIGTWSPTHLLHVQGSARVNSLNINGVYDMPTTAPLNDQVLKMVSGSLQWAADAQGTGGDTDWTEEANLIRAKTGGIVSSSARLFGSNIATHINFGNTDSTGTPGGDYSYITISGGRENRAAMDYATVGGGHRNRAYNPNSTVSGGRYNTAGSLAHPTYSHMTVSGGSENKATGNISTIGGGISNEAVGNVSTIAGGDQNDATNNFATIGGGSQNNVTGYGSTIAGGLSNAVSGGASAIGGGLQNTATGNASAIPGGSYLTVGNRSFGFRGGIGTEPTAVTDVSDEDDTFHIVDTKFHFNYSNHSSADFRIDGAGDYSLFMDADQDRVGIGTNTPAARLDVAGKTKANSIQLTDGANNQYVLVSDAIGNGSWMSPANYADIIENYITVTGGGDNLGNHIATQNLEMRGYWVTNDGDTGDGMFVDANGSAGFNKAVYFAGGNTSIDADGDLKATFLESTGNIHARGDVFGDMFWGAGKATFDGLESTQDFNVIGTGHFDQIESRGGLGVDGFAQLRSNASISGDLGVTDITATDITANNIECVTLTETSDLRFKKDITNMQGTLEKLSQLNGVEFNYRTDDFPEMHFPEQRQTGFIAQEVETVFPELVNTDENGYKSVSYSRLTPLLLEAIKELKAENEWIKEQLLNR
jgi:hypothetical protein